MHGRTSIKSAFPRRLFLLLFRVLPVLLIVLASHLAWPAFLSLRASAESLECYCPSCPEDLLAETGLKRLGLIRVDVAGAVKNPGIYELGIGSRRADLLLAAGGPSEDISKVFLAKTFNLSQELEDGEKIYLPYAWEEEWELAPRASQGVSTDDASAAPSTNNVVSKLISINAASASELESLPGIGEKRASDIVAGRPYASLNELTEKAGLTASIFDDIKDLISL